MNSPSFRNLIAATLLPGILAAGILASAPAVLAQSNGAELREVPYLTLRNRTGRSDPDQFYGDERGDLKAGICHVSASEIPVVSSFVDVAPFRIPEEILSVSAVEELPAEDLLTKLESTSEGETIVLYIHGYKMDFDRACRRASVFQRSAGFEGRLLLFSWPSDGNAVNYTHDEADLGWSVPDAADIIATLAERFGQGHVNVVGHSLGGRGVALALYDVASRYSQVRVNEVVLLAPDIDFQLFQKILPQFRPIAERITVYVAEGDRPLALSEAIHGYPRLGQSGNDVETLSGVEVVDLSDLPIRSATGHLYHLYNPEVGLDIGNLIDRRLSAGDRGLVNTGSNLWRLQPDAGD